jgi:hypothetical protein
MSFLGETGQTHYIRLHFADCFVGAEDEDGI